MNRTKIINRLIRLNGYMSYLEIGVRNPSKNFNKIQADTKDGVDPAGSCNYQMTSDEFFKKNKNKYDLIFIDGMHEYHQVVRDVNNSLDSLNENGTIVLHDCNPSLESHQIPFEQWSKKGVWNGTVWMAFAKLRSTRSDLNMCVVDCDFGVGIITKGNQQTIRLDEKDINYKYFNNNRIEILNLISKEEFIEKFNNIKET